MILVISAVFPPEPVVSAQLSLNVSQWLSQKDRVEVICPQPSRPFGTKYNVAKTEINQFKQVVVKSYFHPGTSLVGRMIESISFGRESSKQIRKNQSKVAVVYANTWPLFAQFSIVRTCKRLKIPLVLHVQDVYPETLTERLGVIGPLVKALLMPIDKYVMRHSHSVVAIGSRMAKYLAISRKVNEKKITVVYNWQDDSRSNVSNSVIRYKSQFTFMYLGSLSPSANIEAVIKSFGQAAFQDSKFIIAGSGTSKESCIKTASAYPEADISFIDAPLEKVPHLLSSADVLLLPLKKGVGKYSIPSKLAGYMFSSKPVLAYIDPDCDAADIISASGCGWIIPVGNGQMLTDKMRELQSMRPEKLLSLGRAGRDYALTHLSKSTNLKKLVDIIKNSTKQ